MGGQRKIKSFFCPLGRDFLHPWGALRAPQEFRVILWKGFYFTIDLITAQHSSRTAPAQLPRKESWNFCQKKALWGEPQNENLSKTSRSPTQLGKLAPDLRMAEQPPKSEPRIDWRAASAPQERAGSSRPSCPPRRPCGYLVVLISGLGQGRGGRKYEGIPSLFC